MWIFFALSASFLWGLTYILDEQIFKKVSVPSSLAITCLITGIVMLLVAYFTGSIRSDFIAITSSKKLLLLVILGTVTFVLAELFIGLSISTKNAALSGLVEISYPIFIVLFGAVLFNENQITLYTILGGFLIFAGVGVIYFFSK